MTGPCGACGGEGWVCEGHPDRPWREADGCQCAAGMPCRACNPCDREHAPRWPPGTTPIWDIEHGWWN